MKNVGKRKYRGNNSTEKFENCENFSGERERPAGLELQRKKEELHKLPRNYCIPVFYFSSGDYLRRKRWENENKEGKIRERFENWGNFSAWNFLNVGLFFFVLIIPISTHVIN